MIGDSLFQKKIVIEEITDLSLNIPGKLMNSIPLLTNWILIKCLIWVYIWPERMLIVTPGKKGCIIKSMSSIREFISLNIQITNEEIERVTQRERAICQLEIF